MNLRGCPGENHAKPGRRCYRLVHGISSYFACWHTLVHFSQMWYNLGSSSFSLCFRGVPLWRALFTVLKARNVVKFECCDLGQYTS